MDNSKHAAWGTYKPNRFSCFARNLQYSHTVGWWRWRLWLETVDPWVGKAQYMFVCLFLSLGGFSSVSSVLGGDFFFFCSISPASRPLVSLQDVRKYYFWVSQVGTRLEWWSPALNSSWFDRCISDISSSFSKTLCISQVLLWKELRKSKGVTLEEEVRESTEEERFVERTNQGEVLTEKWFCPLRWCGTETRELDQDAGDLTAHLLCGSVVWESWGSLSSSCNNREEVICLISLTC